MNTQIYEEATQWLIKHREAGLDLQEKSAFDTWLRESPQHVRAYLEMSAVWEDVPALDASWNPAAEQLIDHVRGEGNIVRFAHNAPAPPPAATSRAGRNGSAVKFFALAATIVIIAVGMTAWHWFNLNTYTTDVGEQRSIVLADGSTVDLNSRSRVRIHFAGSQRDVDLLDGQALFRVAHDSSRPFIVHSGTADVRAVGTQFDVYRKRAGTVVTVVEGKVAIVSSAFAAAQDLTAGEQLTVPSGRPSAAGNSYTPERQRHANVATATAWTQRTLVFDSSPLTDVAEEFNRYNTRQLVITDPVLSRIRISGMFSSADPALLLQFLHSQAELQLEETASEIRVSKK